MYGIMRFKILGGCLLRKSVKGYIRAISSRRAPEYTVR